MNVLVADIETDGLLDELTTMWCIGVGDPKTGEVVLYADAPGYPSITEGLQRLRVADRVVFHNAFGFDYPALVKLFGPGVVRFDAVWDSLVVARALDPLRKDHSLASYGDDYGYPKGDHNDWTRFSDEMAVYCVRDVEITIKLYRDLQRTLKRHYKEGTDWRKALWCEFRVQHVIAQQERHGFRLNVDGAEGLAAELRQEQVELEQELQRVFPPKYVPAKAKWDYENRKWVHVDVTTPKVNNGPRGITKDAPYCKVKLQMFNPGSRPQIVQRLTEQFGWKPAKFTDTGQPAVDDAVLAELPYEEAKPLARYFRLVKQLGQIVDGKNAWLKLVDSNNYVHGRVNTLGARTHRMSHFAPNMAQVDKKDLRMREVWLPDPGHKLVGCDAEGLELRMLGHDLAFWDRGRFAKAVVEGRKEDGTDAHSMAMRAIGMFSRDNTKTFEYALIYGAGDPKLGRIIIADAMDADKPKPKGTERTIGKRARERFIKGIVGLEKLVDLCKKRTREVGYVKALDGRRLLSDSEHSALNTRLQGNGAVVMKWALVIFHFEYLADIGAVDPETYLIADDWQDKFGYCANVHDEVQMSVVPEHSEQFGQLFAKAIEEAGVRLGVRCPLAGSYDIGNNWKETH